MLIQTSNPTPELLAPAGSMDKLKIVVSYGAHAVYLSGQKFGLRTAADNFTDDELKEALAYAHKYQVKTYITLNGLLHDEDLKSLPQFVRHLESLGAHGVIASDLGVISLVRKHSDLPIHLSTQASCLNSYSARFWKELGVKRIVLGREVSLEEAKRIKSELSIELEMFIHGSMCMSYSGNCTISNFTQGRDSNRGGCAHSCRFEYDLEFPNQRINSFFMSSKDLRGLDLIGEYIDAGIDSLEVEGRMKGPLYAASTTRVYAQALKYWSQRTPSQEQINIWLHELEKIGHRDYTHGSLINPATEDSVYQERDHEIKDFVVAAVVREVKKQNHILVEVRSAFHPNDQIECLPFNGDVIKMDSSKVTDFYEQDIHRTRPGQLVKLPYLEGVEEYNLIRVKQVGGGGDAE